MGCGGVVAAGWADDVEGTSVASGVEGAIGATLGAGGLIVDCADGLVAGVLVVGVLGDELVLVAAGAAGSATWACADCEVDSASASRTNLDQFKTVDRKSVMAPVSIPHL
jgi:hypothetical protein